MKTNNFLALVLLLLAYAAQAQTPGTVDPTFQYVDPKEERIYNELNSPVLKHRFAEAIPMPGGSHLFPQINSSYCNGNITFFGAPGTINNEQYLVKYKPDWTIDNTFYLRSFTPRISLLEFSKIVVQSDGKIIIGGIFNAYDGNQFSTTGYNVIRLNQDGSFDSGFGFKNVNVGTSEMFTRNFLLVNDDLLLHGTLYKANGTTYNIQTPGIVNPGYIYYSNFEVIGSNVYFIAKAITTPGPWYQRLYLFSAATGATSLVVNYDSIANLGTNSIFWGSVLKLNNNQIIVSAEEANKSNAFIVNIQNGTPNQSFTNNLLNHLASNEYFFARHVDPNGKILGVVGIKLIRLNNDGTKDNTFTNYYDLSNSIASGGSSFIGGDFNNIYSFSINNVVKYTYTLAGRRIILNEDGSVYTDFKSSNFGQVSGGDGSILVPDITLSNADTVITNTPFGGVQKLLPNGIMDTIFGYQGGRYGNYFSGITAWFTVKSSSKCLQNGQCLFSRVSGDIYRLNPNGTTDSLFLQNGTLQNPPTNLGPNRFTRCLVEQPDGKILAGGRFDFSGGQFSGGSIVRLNADGTVDFSFNSATGFKYSAGTPNTNGIVNKILLQPDGKIIVAGLFDSYNGFPCKNIIRLKTDGNVDSTFITAGTGFNDEVLCADLQANGKIVLGGKFTQFNGITVNRIVRLNANGTFDGSFNVQNVFGNYGISPNTFPHVIKDLKVQQNGKVVVGGAFKVNAANKYGIARLDSNGVLDNSFYIPRLSFTHHSIINNVVANQTVNYCVGDTLTDANAVVERIQLQSDGKILALGNFMFAEGARKLGLVRLYGDEVITGIDEFENNDLLNSVTVNIFPNPTTGKITLTLSEAGNYNLNIYNSIGQQVYNGTMQNTQEQVIDLGNAAKGIYYVQLGNGKENISKTIVIE